MEVRNFSVRLHDGKFYDRSIGYIRTVVGRIKTVDTHGNEPVMLTKKMLFERIEACNGSVDVFLKESLGRYAYVEVQLWNMI